MFIDIVFISICYGREPKLYIILLDYKLKSIIIMYWMEYYKAIKLFFWQNSGKLLLHIVNGKYKALKWFITEKLYL